MLPLGSVHMKDCECVSISCCIGSSWNKMHCFSRLHCIYFVIHSAIRMAHYGISVEYLGHLLHAFHPPSCLSFSLAAAYLWLIWDHFPLERASLHSICCSLTSTNTHVVMHRETERDGGRKKCCPEH